MTEQLTPNGTKVWEGSWEEIALHAEELSGLKLRLEAIGPLPTVTQHAGRLQRATLPAGAKHPTGRGKLAGLLSSEDVMRAKREDLALEERRR